MTLGDVQVYSPITDFFNCSFS